MRRYIVCAVLPGRARCAWCVWYDTTPPTTSFFVQGVQVYRRSHTLGGCLFVCGKSRSIFSLESKLLWSCGILRLALCLPVRARRVVSQRGAVQHQQGGDAHRRYCSRCGIVVLVQSVGGWRGPTSNKLPKHEESVFF